MMKSFAASLAVLLVLIPFSLEAQKFYPDDPVKKDLDLVDVAGEPAEVELSDMYDRFSNIFHDFGVSPIGSEALSVNTLDEVPDSAWFTNRHGVKRMSLDELRRGPNRGTGPDPKEKWFVFRGKSQGLTPGFQIKDGKGDRYVIKVDPIEVPEIASAAEIIATKIFYAVGYNVPENYIVYRPPGEIEIEPGTMVEDQFGDKVPLTRFRFNRMIRRIQARPDGTSRLVASKYIPGKPLGPFRYHGTRSDDPNDVVPHEDLRELRGLRLFSAWTNHDDTRAQNTQDTWVEQNGRHIIRHYLMDFGSTFGSGSVDMQYAHLAFHYSMDFEMMKRNLKGFGFHVPTYRKAKWPEFPKYRSVGRWEGDLFDPDGWKNDYPNAAFLRMTPRDAFWAAKIIMRFTREELETIVETGEYSDPDNAAYFLEVLLERQRKCGEFGINSVNPIDEIRLSNETLEFTNMSEKYGFMEGATEYRIAWSIYNNKDGSLETLRGPVLQTQTTSPLPETEYYRNQDHLLLLAEIHSLNENYPHWAKRIGVYFRPSRNGYEIVGIDRES